MEGGVDGEHPAMKSQSTESSATSTRVRQALRASARQLFLKHCTSCVSKFWIGQGGP
jgi:hypothetical protein